MSYEVSDEEKVQAEKALLYFNHATKMLDLAANHLDLMKNPFKDNADVDEKELINARAAIRRFRDKSIENFNEFKITAFKCVNIMQNFSTDTQTVKVIKSFISSIDELENKVNNFSGLFSDLDDKDFTKNIVTSIEDIQKQCEEVNEIIEERVKNHIKNDILATSWVNSVSDELNIKIEPKIPLILDLFNKRQDQLNEEIKERTSEKV